MGYNNNRQPGGGRGDGSGRGRGSGRGIGGGGRNSGMGMGAGGWCICTSCGNKVTHTRGVTCNQIQCSSCGGRMTRDVGTQRNLPRLDPRPSNPTQRNIQRFKNPIVDEEKCVGCSLCLSSCPVHAIQMVNGKAHIQENICQGCKACIPSCPHGAIS